MEFSSLVVYAHNTSLHVISHYALVKLFQGSCKATYTFFDGCPVVVADDDTACMYSVNTPGINVYDTVVVLVHSAWCAWCSKITSLQFPTMEVRCMEMIQSVLR